MMFFGGPGALGRCFGYGAGFMHSGWGLLMMGGALLVAILVVAAVVVIVRKSRRTDIERGDGSLAVLNERFVKGEITEEEYTRMKKVLRTK